MYNFIYLDFGYFLDILSLKEQILQQLTLICSTLCAMTGVPIRLATHKRVANSGEVLQVGHWQQISAASSKLQTFSQNCFPNCIIQIYFLRGGINFRLWVWAWKACGRSWSVPGSRSTSRRPTPGRQCASTSPGGPSQTRSVHLWRVRWQNHICIVWI